MTISLDTKNEPAEPRVLREGLPRQMQNPETAKTNTVAPAIIAFSPPARTDEYQRLMRRNIRSHRLPALRDPRMPPPKGVVEAFKSFIPVIKMEEKEYPLFIQHGRNLAKLFIFQEKQDLLLNLRKEKDPENQIKLIETYVNTLKALYSDTMIGGSVLDDEIREIILTPKSILADLSKLERELSELEVEIQNLPEQYQKMNSSPRNTLNNFNLLCEEIINHRIFGAYCNALISGIYEIVPNNVFSDYLKYLKHFRTDPNTDQFIKTLRNEIKEFVKILENKIKKLKEDRLESSSDGEILANTRLFFHVSIVNAIYECESNPTAIKAPLWQLKAKLKNMKLGDVAEQLVLTETTLKTIQTLISSDPASYNEHSKTLKEECDVLLDKYLEKDPDAPRELRALIAYLEQ